VCKSHTNTEDALVVGLGEVALLEVMIERALEGKLIVLPSTNPERRDILAASRQRVQMVKARRRGKFVSLRSS